MVLVNNSDVYMEVTEDYKIDVQEYCLDFDDSVKQDARIRPANGLIAPSVDFSIAGPFLLFIMIEARDAIDVSIIELQALHDDGCRQRFPCG